MSISLSTNMNLPIPGVGSEAGPQYALDINNSLTLIDQHNHAPGYGVQITPSGLNINSDLTFNDNNLINTRSLRLAVQPATLSLSSDVGCLYEVGVDLYYNDGNGNQIRITQSGGVAGTPGSISNLTSPASASYIALNETFVWQSAANTPANLDAASVILRNLVANSNSLTLNPPNSMPTDYSITLPTLPASNLPLSINNTGVMSTSQISTAQIANNAITTALINDGAVTSSKLSALNYQISSSCGIFSAITSLTPITNLSVTITTTGRPVQLMLIDDSSGNTSFIGANDSTGGGNAGVAFAFYRDTTQLSLQEIESVTAASFTLISFPCSSLQFVDFPSAGTYTYVVKGESTVAGSSVRAEYCKLVAYEL